MEFSIKEIPKNISIKFIKFHKISLSIFTLTKFIREGYKAEEKKLSKS